MPRRPRPRATLAAALAGGTLVALTVLVAPGAAAGGGHQPYAPVLGPTLDDSATYGPYVRSVRTSTATYMSPEGTDGLGRKYK